MYVCVWEIHFFPFLLDGTLNGTAPFEASWTCWFILRSMTSCMQVPSIWFCTIKTEQTSITGQHGLQTSYTLVLFRLFHMAPQRSMGSSFCPPRNDLWGKNHLVIPSLPACDAFSHNSRVRSITFRHLISESCIFITTVFSWDSKEGKPLDWENMVRKALHSCNIRTAVTAELGDLHDWVYIAW